MSYICFSTKCKYSLNIDILRETRCIFWWLPMVLYRTVICGPAMVAEMKCQGQTWLTDWLHALKLGLDEMEWGLDIFFHQFSKPCNIFMLLPCLKRSRVLMTSIKIQTWSCFEEIPPKWNPSRAVHQKMPHFLFYTS